MIWLDLNLDATLGTSLTTIWRPAARRLKLIDPRVVNRFIDVRSAYENAAHVLTRLLPIHSAISNGTVSPHLFNKLETLDSIRQAGILHADRKCRKLKHGNIACSPTYQTEVFKIRYLKSCIRYYNPAVQHRRLNSRTLLKQRQAAGFEEPITDIEQARLLLRQTFQSYNTVIKQATTLRVSYLKDLSGAIAEQDLNNPDTIHEQLLLREKQRSLSRKLKLIKGLSKGILTRI
jgi:hypothetical protein